MQSINPETLRSMNALSGRYPIKVDLAYARPDNLLFGEQIYRSTAELWLHEDLAAIVIEAAQRCHDRTGYQFVLYDGLRTVDAQEKMLHTRRVQQNPHWLEEPRLLSPPGQGGHPRGMAIDIVLENQNGSLVDMGTPFDFLAHNPSPDTNMAHRDYPGLSPEVIANRAILTNAMTHAARSLNLPLLPLPQEWWDFRLPADVYNQYAPLRDRDLPPHMRMVS
jgi:D-alanyl-D-alanine dipeptidase